MAGLQEEAGAARRGGGQEVVMSGLSLHLLEAEPHPQDSRNRGWLQAGLGRGGSVTT